MTDKDVFSQSYQKWDARYQQSSVDAWAMRPEIGREVTLAVDAYHARFGDNPARAVDIGAGDGRHTLYLAERGFDVLAVDAAPAGIDLIRQKLDKAALSAELVVADLREYVIPDNVDFLLASYIIHLLPNPYEQLKVWQDKVRAGGICVVSTRGAFPHDPDDYWFPEEFELKHLFQDAGWFVLHAYEEDIWRPKMEMLFRQRAVIAFKPE